MRIKFERTGGFAGMVISASFDLDEMDKDEAKSLKEMLDDLDFGDLPEIIIGKAPVPDQFTYKVTVVKDEWEHTVVTGDTSAPEKMQPFLQTLNRLARGQGKRLSSASAG